MRPVQRGRRRHEELAALPPDQQRAAAHDACLRALASRPRSRAELHRRLTEAGHHEDVVDPVLDRLAEAGLVDDAQFADAWVRSRHAGAGRSRRMLARELGTKGVASEHVEAALLQVDDSDEQARALELARQGLRRVTVPQDRAGRDAAVRRLVGRLARRGYPTRVAVAAVTSALEERAASDEEAEATTSDLTEAPDDAGDEQQWAQHHD